MDLRLKKVPKMDGHIFKRGDHPLQKIHIDIQVLMVDAID